MIAGLYNQDFVVPVSKNDEIENLYVINASGSDRVMIGFSGKSSRWDVIVHDCTGKVVEEKTASASGVVTFDVPASGLIGLSRLRRPQ